jgi:Domain of unknown function (DUF5666)
MKFYKAFSVLSLLACLSLTSCYHQFPTGGGGGGGNNDGNAFFNVTVTATPSSTFFFPSLNWQLGNVLLFNAAGVPTPIVNGSGNAILDFARLQTDTTYMGHTFVGATSYNKLQVQFNSPVRFSYVYNSTNATLFSGSSACAPGLVCLIPDTVPGFSSSTVNVPITFTAAANTNTGIRINFDLSKAVTTAGGLTFDFTQPGAITITTLPPTSSQTSGLDTIDNATGVVTAVSGTSLTIGNFSVGQAAYTVAANATFNDPLSVAAKCTTQPPNATCLAVGQNISIDGVIAPDGTRTANEIEFLDPAPAVNELEGIIISPVTNNQFKMILTNGMGSNILIATSPVLVNLNGSETYFLDPKNLQTPISQTGFLSQADLVVGQTVMVQGGTFSGNNTSITNPTRVLLRYSSISGLVQAPSGTIFSLGSVSPFFANLVSNSVQTQTFTTTAYDNITGFSGLVGGTTSVSVRGLYLNPTSGAQQPLLAAKIRSH